MNGTKNLFVLGIVLFASYLCFSMDHADALQDLDYIEAIKHVYRAMSKANLLNKRDLVRELEQLEISIAHGTFHSLIEKYKEQPEELKEQMEICLENLRVAVRLFFPNQKERFAID